MIGDFNDETNFPLILLTDTQVLRFCKSFANNSSANMKLSKTQLSLMVQSGGFLPSLLPQFNEFNTKINKGFIYRRIEKTNALLNLKRTSESSCKY